MTKKTLSWFCRWFWWINSPICNPEIQHTLETAYSKQGAEWWSTQNNWKKSNQDDWGVEYRALAGVIRKPHLQSLQFHVGEDVNATIQLPCGKCISIHLCCTYKEHSVGFDLCSLVVHPVKCMLASLSTRGCSYWRIENLKNQTWKVQQAAQDYVVITLVEQSSNINLYLPKTCIASDQRSSLPFWCRQVHGNRISRWYLEY